MYKRFFDLCAAPFSNTPDPSFRYASRSHDESMAVLYYLISARKGIGVMTGESGTGKTLLVRCLLELLNRDQTTYAYVFNPRLSASEFVQYVASDFGLPVTGRSKAEILFDLARFLLSRQQKNLTTVLIVDEAHLLPAEAL